MDIAELEQLIAHAARYFTMVATLEKTEAAWFLHGGDLPAYRDANHALRLRDDGRGPEAVARQVIGAYRARGLPAVADVDTVAEAQGIGAALRRLGVTPLIGDMLFMGYAAATPPVAAPHPLEIQVVPNETGQGEAQVWIETAVSDSEGDEDAAMWRAVAEREARTPECRLYLGLLDGVPVGACDLFTAEGWGRVDSVVTHPAFRRRGVASALVARAVADSFTMGNATTYLFTEAGGAGERVYTRLGFQVRGVNVLRRHLQR